MAWADEGIIGYVSTSMIKGSRRLELPSGGESRTICYIARSESDGYVELHLLEHEESGDQVYTDDEEEILAFTDKGYNYRRVVGCVRDFRQGEDVPIFRAYDPNTKHHLYTTDVEIIDKEGPKLTKDELEDYIKDNLGESMTSDGKECIFLADKEYFCTTWKAANAIIEEAKVDDLSYRVDVGDCDDYAHLLKSAFITDAWCRTRRSLPYACGILWGYQRGATEPHAMNFLVTSDGEKKELIIFDACRRSKHKPEEGILNKICLTIC